MKAPQAKAPLKKTVPEKVVPPVAKAKRVDTISSVEEIDRTKNWYLLGIAHLQQGDNVESLSCLNKAVCISPNDYAVWERRGEAKRRLRQFEEAILDYSEAIRLKPDEVAAWLGRADSQRLLERHAEAIPDYDEALRLAHSGDCNILESRGESKRAVGLYEEAILDFEASMRYGRRSVMALAGLGQAKRMLKRYKEARRDLEEAVSLDPHGAIGNIARKELASMKGESVATKDEQKRNLISQGMTHYEKKEYVEAVAALDKAMAISRKFYYIWQLRGAAKRMLEQYEDAIRDLEQAVKLNPKSDVAIKELAMAKEALEKQSALPNNPSPNKPKNPGVNITKVQNDKNQWIDKGSTHYLNKEYAEAISCFDKVIALDPKDYYAFQMRGASKRLLGHPEDAIRDLEAAIKLNPDIEYAKQQLILAKEEWQKKPSANKPQNPGLNISPVQSDKNDWTEQGRAHYRNKEYVEAISCFDNAIELDPKDYVAFQMRGESKRVLLRPGEAIPDLEEATKLNPTSDFAKEQLIVAQEQLKKDNKKKLSDEGVEHFNKKEYAEAISCFDKVINLDRKNFHAFQTRGAAKRILGHLEEAVRDLEEAIKLNPESDFAQKELGVAEEALAKKPPVAAAPEKLYANTALAPKMFFSAEKTSPKTPVKKAIKTVGLKSNPNSPGPSSPQIPPKSLYKAGSK